MRQWPAHRSIKGQNEAPLGVILCGSAVAPVSPAFQVLKAVVGVVQHGSLLTGLLSAGIRQREHAAVCGGYAGAALHCMPQACTECCAEFLGYERLLLSAQPFTLSIRCPV